MTRHIRSLLVVALLGLALMLHAPAVGADAPCINDGQGLCVSQPADVPVGQLITGAEPLSVSLVAAPPESALPAWMACTLPMVDVVPCEVP